MRIRLLTIVSILLYVLLGVILSACVQTVSPADANINITLEVSPQPPVVGESELHITLTDADGSPITTAALEIQGDMSHAGMVPVLRDIEQAGEGSIYRVPFEWTMGGDWFVTVIAILEDGSEIEQAFDLSVATEGEGEMAHDEMEHGDDKEGHDGDSERHGEGHDDKEGHDEDGEGHGNMEHGSDKEGDEHGSGE